MKLLTRAEIASVGLDMYSCWDEDGEEGANIRTGRNALHRDVKVEDANGPPDESLIRRWTRSASLRFSWFPMDGEAYSGRATPWVKALSLEVVRPDIWCPPTYCSHSVSDAAFASHRLPFAWAPEAAAAA